MKYIGAGPESILQVDREERFTGKVMMKSIPFYFVVVVIGLLGSFALAGETTSSGSGNGYNGYSDNQGQLDYGEGAWEELTRKQKCNRAIRFKKGYGKAMANNDIMVKRKCAGGEDTEDCKFAKMLNRLDKKMMQDNLNKMQENCDAGA